MHEPNAVSADLASSQPHLTSTPPFPFLSFIFTIASIRYFLLYPSAAFFSPPLLFLWGDTNDAILCHTTLHDAIFSLVNHLISLCSPNEPFLPRRKSSQCNPPSTLYVCSLACGPIIISSTTGRWPAGSSPHPALLFTYIPDKHALARSALP